MGIFKNLDSFLTRGVAVTAKIDICLLYARYGGCIVWQAQCRPAAMSAIRDTDQPQCIPTAMPANRDVGQRQKRAFGVAKHPREISSDQARRQDAYFFRKGEKI